MSNLDDILTQPLDEVLKQEIKDLMLELIDSNYPKGQARIDPFSLGDYYVELRQKVNEL